MTPNVVVLDYGSGNVHSASKALEAAGATVTLTADPQKVASADGLVVPGVGAFDAVMKQFNLVHGNRLIEQRLIAGKPVLGICVGMQVMFERGVEHGIDTEGLGQWPGTVELLKAEILPHIGWNTVDVPENSRLFQGVADERFYFVHSYGVSDWQFPTEPGSIKPPSVTWADYGGKFVAAIENGPLSATQFHPEKSGEAGIQLLRNWLSSIQERS
ncbi:MAG: imidazole glycerol phosphate synthase subunit HisH [Actinomycetes bacterium]